MKGKKNGSDYHLSLWGRFVFTWKRSGNNSSHLHERQVGNPWLITLRYSPLVMREELPRMIKFGKLVIRQKDKPLLFHTGTW